MDSDLGLWAIPLAILLQGILHALPKKTIDDAALETPKKP